MRLTLPQSRKILRICSKKKRRPVFQSRLGKKYNNWSEGNLPSFASFHCAHWQEWCGFASSRHLLAAKFMTGYAVILTIDMFSYFSCAGAPVTRFCVPKLVFRLAICPVIRCEGQFILLAPHSFTGPCESVHHQPPIPYPNFAQLATKLDAISLLCKHRFHTKILEASIPSRLAV